MKVHQRLDYDRLAEVLGDRGLVDINALQHVLNQCISTGQLFPEVLVNENLISDWELARVACETFNLPFLPVDIYKPSLNATTDLDVSFLHQHGIVPLDRFGTQLTVAMPVIVPSRILTGLEREHSVEVVPVIGCVSSNRLWLQNNLTLQAQVKKGQSGEGAEAGAAGDPWGAFSTPATLLSCSTSRAASRRSSPPMNSRWRAWKPSTKRSPIPAWKTTAC